MPLILTGLVLALSGAFAWSLWGYSRDEPLRKQVRLSSGHNQSVPPAPVTPAKLPLRIAVAAVISPKETMKAYGGFVQYLSRKLDRPVELVQRNTYSEINQLVRDGYVSVALVCSKPYVDGHRDFGMELLAIPQVNGRVRYRSYIIVPESSPARSLKDLRGKSFAFSDPLSYSGKFAPTYMLWKMGEKPETFFHRYVFTYSHDRSIKAVAEKLVDGASVDSMVYEYMVTRTPDYVSKVRIVDRSPEVGNTPFVVHPGLDRELKLRLRNLFLTMHEDPEGRQILTELMIDRFVVPDDSLFEPIRTMEAQVLGQEGSRAKRSSEH
ncbi:MAG: phosphate/phosphite/phosphonate ABC transporter substrate-binding protein [Firmicutes bacterium]|nr:phosphate/phosphite/phosphonate ABC transporter substrate-binding protein [Bacillota bacterium]